MRTLTAIVLALSLGTAAHAAPRKPRAETAEVTAAKADVAAARGAAKLAAHKLRLARAQAAYDKARLRLAREGWLSDCIAERSATMAAHEALEICAAELPTTAEELELSRDR